MRLWIRAAIAAGRTFRMGDVAEDNLDAGNVLGGGGGAQLAGKAGIGSTLWIDLTCDVIDAEIQGGATGGSGIFSKADAATITINLADPSGKYDPLNGNSPYAYGGHSRLVPGVPVEAFAEVVNGDDGSWQRHYLFVGTADSWGEDWVAQPSSRTCQLLATDITKQFVRMNRPEQPEQGAGDTVQDRIHRIVEFFGWPGEVVDPAGGSDIILQATTLAQPAWELLNRATDDEIGYLYFDAEGRLVWVNRQTWQVASEPVIDFGCPYISGGTGFDVLTDAAPSTLDLQMRNRVHASRAGGAMQEALSQASIDRYGSYEDKRTDLGISTDLQVAEWAEYVVVLYAFPQISLSDVTMAPSLSERSWEVWNGALGITMVTDLVSIKWAPPDRPEDLIHAISRVVGYRHAISRGQWEVQWQLVAASSLQFSGSIFTMGSHARDRLDAGYVLGFTVSTGEN